MTETETGLLSRYDIRRSYQWNYDNAPEPVSVEVPKVSRPSTFAGLPVASPLGIPAGPLLNGKWILYYASLGFDVLTYKTVRSGVRECYPLPNLVHVPDHDRSDDACDLVASEDATASWAVSFGMPSAAPDAWRSDIEWTRKRLAEDKVMSVSVVGTVQPGWTIDDLADDYARCARWAVESGADAIEANLSCPNVDTCDGQLFQRPDDSALVAAAIRREIGDVPLILKIGHVVDHQLARSLLAAVSATTTAVAMTNSVAGRVRAADKRWLFDGKKRGICGLSTFAASLSQIAIFSQLIQSTGSPIRIIGVGGASTAVQVNQFLDAGAECVHLATAAMLDPAVAIKIKSTI